jgi:hypothetical protein
MKRRDFILASGSTVLSGLVASGIQRPAIGLDFEISTPDKDPSKVDSLVIDFETLEITPRYLDEKEPVSVQAKVELNGRIEKSNEVQTSVVNGESKNLENNINSIVVDGLNASSTISGDVTVSIDHPDIQDSYSRQFEVNGSEIPDSGVSRWEFDDSTDTTTATDSWDTNNGTINGATYTNGYQGSGALDFDGTDDFVDTGYDGSVWFTEEWTFSAWLKWTSDSIDNYAGQRDSESKPSIQFRFNADGVNGGESLGNVEVLERDAEGNYLSWGTQNQNLDDGNWHHVVFTMNDQSSEDVSTFVDGSLVGGKRETGNTFDQGSFNSNFALGGALQSGSINNPGNIVLDDVRLYDKALSSAEVNNLYNNGSIDTLLPNNILTQYRYEDDSDTTTAIDSVVDNDATVSGSSYTTTAAVGNNALDHDGTDDYATSNSAVNLAERGNTDGFGFGGFVQSNSVIKSTMMFQYFVDANNWVNIQVGGSDSNYGVAMTVNGTFDSLNEAGTVETTQFAHIWANITQSDVTLYKNNSELFTASHSFDMTNLGTGHFVTGRDGQDQFYFDGKIDEFTIAEEPLNSSERQTLIDREN